MVRLKGESVFVLLLAFVFQFQMVRLKVAEKTRFAIVPTTFQFQMVRLKVAFKIFFTSSLRHFNSRWFD